MPLSTEHRVKDNSTGHAELREIASGACLLYTF